MGSHSHWQTLAGLLLAAATVIAPAQAAPTARELNDTGLTTCVKPDRSGSGKIDCAGSGQDGEFGRDVTARDDSDGKAGFAYVKIGDAGEQLPADARSWACVLDEVSGLMWEEKTLDNGPRDMFNIYSNVGDDSPGDTSTFVRSVNETGLCGYSDWRLPDRLELLGLVNYGKSLFGRGGMILSQLFPNTALRDYWTSTDYSPTGPDDAWAISFEGGDAVDAPRGGRFLAVRLVRDARPPVPAQDIAAAPARFVPRGDEVVDTTTGLIWRRCSEGQAWTGSTCSGDATLGTWRRALVAARGAAGNGTGWRLPNVKELGSLVDDTRSAPAIDAAMFPQTPAAIYWTSSHVVGSETFVRHVDFQDGRVFNQFKNASGAARLVRTAR